MGPGFRNPADLDSGAGCTLADTEEEKEAGASAWTKADDFRRSSAGLSRVFLAQTCGMTSEKLWDEARDKRRRIHRAKTPCVMTDVPSSRRS